MQQDSYDEFDAEADRPLRFGRLRAVVSTAIGATVAMALLMALGVWFYRLGVRDAENVPIIRAALEPEKERPVDPGGLVTPHQGVQSYEVAEGQGEAQAASVVLAPEVPQLGTEDIAMGELAPTPPERPEPVEEEQVASAAPVVETPVPTPAPEPVPTPAVVSEPEPEAEAPVQPEAQPEPTPVVTTGTEFAPANSPIARARPANLRERTRQAAQREVQAEADLVARAANSAVQIQLAADPSEAVVRRLWSRISRANSDLLGDRALAVPTTVSGGVTYYRLRVGPFRDAAEARAICQALKARGQDCIVARNG